jgi:hypothetical protein
MNNLQTLKLNKKAFKLYQKAKKLSQWSTEVKTFMLNSSKHIPITSPELTNLFEILIFVVEKTQIFPSEAQFRIKFANKVLYLNSSGDFLEQRLIIDDMNTIGHQNKGPIHLSPQLDLNSVDFSTFISGFFRGHISEVILKELCSIPEPLKVVWDIKLIRTIYLKYSTPKWESPLETMDTVQKILINRAYPRKYVRLIENALVNGARLGFNPVDILKKNIIPAIENYGDKPEEFQEIMQLYWSMTRRLNSLFGKQNDGTTFNQYSLRKFMIPLLSPDSRFIKERSISETDRLFRDMAVRWKEVFTEPHKYTKDIFDNYGEIYISNVCKNEDPEYARREIIRLLNHIDFISARIDSEKQFKRFLKPLHVQGFEEIRKNSLSSKPQTSIRLTMQKHFEIIEEYTILDFPIDYRQYMTFFSGGFIQSPDDIDFFQNAVRNIRMLNSTETDEILRVMMAFASDVKETQKILDYISSCKVFDREIYQKWKNLKEDKQDEAIYSLNKTFDRYILDPTHEISIKELPKIERVIENAIIKQLIKSPRINRQEIDYMLNNEITAMEPMLPVLLTKPIDILVPEKLYTRKSSSTQEFLSIRQRFVNRASKMLSDEMYRDRLTTSIIKAGVYHYGSNYENISQHVMRSFQTFTGEINNLSGTAAEIGRECSSLILTQEPELALKTINIMEELILSGILSSVHVSQLAYPPFSGILEKPERDVFSKSNILPLIEIYSVYFREYINDFCIRKSAQLPPMARTLFLKSFQGAETMMECAALIYDKLFEFLNLNRFDSELESLVGEERNGKTRKITLVAGKRKLDQFFSYAGEMGYRSLFNEIKRKDFIPIRVIDPGTMELCGYITAFITVSSDNRKKILLLSGIYVKERWIIDLDEVIFYREVRKALVNFAKKVDADLLCVTKSGPIHSGCNSLISLMKSDLDDKPQLITSTQLNFPDKAFDLSAVHILWKKKSE